MEPTTSQASIHRAKIHVEFNAAPNAPSTDEKQQICNQGFLKNLVFAASDAQQDGAYSIILHTRPALGRQRE